MGDEPSFGLCDGCQHQRLVPNTRGSVFNLCRRSGNDPDFPRYPRVPVLRCRGFEPRPSGPVGPESPPHPGRGSGS